MTTAVTLIGPTTHEWEGVGVEVSCKRLAEEATKVDRVKQFLIRSLEWDFAIWVHRRESADTSAECAGLVLTDQLINWDVGWAWLYGLPELTLCSILYFTGSLNHDIILFILWAAKVMYVYSENGRRKQLDNSSNLDTPPSSAINLMNTDVFVT